MAINFDNLLLEEDSVLALMTGADKESGAARFEPRSSRDRRRQRKERLMQRSDSGLFHFQRNSWPHFSPHSSVKEWFEHTFQRNYVFPDCVCMCECVCLSIEFFSMCLVMFK